MFDDFDRRIIDALNVRPYCFNFQNSFINMYPRKLNLKFRVTVLAVKPSLGIQRS